MITCMTDPSKSAVLLSFVLQPNIEGTCQLMSNCWTMQVKQAAVSHSLGQS